MTMLAPRPTWSQQRVRKVKNASLFTPLDGSMNDRMAVVFSGTSGNKTHKPRCPITLAVPEDTL